MQIYFKQNLAFLAVPKTGTTAYELALRNEADIVFAKRRKHMTAGQFERRMMPFLSEFYDLKPERMAIMRDPIEQIRSWFRYRTDPKRKNRTEGLTFDEFVLATMQDPEPPFAAIGSQYGFLTMVDGTQPIEHLFAYESQRVVRGWLEERFEKHLKFPIKNVSPEAPTPLSPEVETKLREARAPEFALYDRILQAGGHLKPLES
ncbi:sulfotransferase family 2 domain-containing protein [Cognatishimia activa]|uniref:sulfotransferase family 2 domain-containing protein n=1 Tax=Cognatishimia activa TaxID=1715691 RepID=UPI00223042C7|nr:sulfotransferase family 2 domain-containing protein [Cognatishimia activa]UZD89605.1 sulfotransferase family 2 domain-containing protein [Cognatishimia activa]